MTVPAPDHLAAIQETERTIAIAQVTRQRLAEAADQVAECMRALEEVIAHHKAMREGKRP